MYSATSYRIHIRSSKGKKKLKTRNFPIMPESRPFAASNFHASRLRLTSDNHTVSCTVAGFGAFTEAVMATVVLSGFFNKLVQISHGELSLHDLSFGETRLDKKNWQGHLPSHLLRKARQLLPYLINHQWQLACYSRIHTP